MLLSLTKWEVELLCLQHGKHGKWTHLTRSVNANSGPELQAFREAQHGAVVPGTVPDEFAGETLSPAVTAGGTRLLLEA